MAKISMITEIEPGQRYAEFHPSDMDREVFTFIRTEPTSDSDYVWLFYTDEDGAEHKTNAPARMAVFPVGPAPSVVRAAAAQLNAEMNHPAFKAALTKIMNEEV
jgi:hypothetical protein